MRFFTCWLALFAALNLVACGGGGGSAGTPNGGSATPTTPVVPAAPQVVAEVVGSGGAKVTSISFGGTSSARATLKDASGAPVANRRVDFSIADPALATVNPVSALTNGAGVAEVSVTPASVAAVGATTLSVSATIGGTTVSGSVDFAVAAANVSLSAIALGSPMLPSGGNTSVRVVAMRAGAPLTGVPVNVSFAASCGRINGTAGTFSVTTDGTGAAESVYSAVAADGSLCSGPVSITAATSGAATVSATVTVAAPTANAVAFVSATPAQIFIAGSGAVEQSVVRFRVQSSAGTALANVPVIFSLVNNPGGVGLNASGATGSVTATTNANGEATVAVFSGSLPGPVRVRASLVSNSGVFAESQNLTVASGPPSQRFMSLSASTFNIEGADRDGSLTTLTVRIADRQGNAVDDGTVINFTAEGGQVARSCATTRTNNISSCSVDFVSQNPRPANGRVSVLAFTEGTKDYTDQNANNRFDPGSDALMDIGDAYRDDDENNQFDAGEFTLTRLGGLPCVGAGGLFPKRANTCDGLLATTVRQQAVILFSSSRPKLTTVMPKTTSRVEFKLSSSDPTPLLPMPAGTTFAATALGGTCAVASVQGAIVPNVGPGSNPQADLSTSHVVNLTNCTSADSLVITITSPSGLVTPITVPLAP